MKKLFVCTIPMLAPDELNEINYQTEHGTFIRRSAFPSIVLLDKYIQTDDTAEVEIAVIRDDCDNSTRNYNRFLDELNILSAEKGLALNVKTDICIPHNESKVKHFTIFGALMSLYSENSENCKLFIDISFGSKVTATELFSSSFYAESQKLVVEEICYGFFDHSIKNNKTGIYYSIRYIYDLVALMNSSASFMPSDKIKSLIKGLI